MFIALSCCKNKEIKGDLTIITLPFKGVAYGQKVIWIKAYYESSKYEFNFRPGENYIVYLEKKDLKDGSLWGKIIYYQNLSEMGFE